MCHGRLFGVPYTTLLREQYTAAMIERENTKPEDSPTRRALDAHDGYLEVIANRSSGLVGGYSIFLAVLLYLSEGAAPGLLQYILTAAAVALAVAVFMLLPCLRIYWQPNPDTYKDAQGEFDSTMKLLYRRSTLFNGSIFLSRIAIIVSAAAFGYSFALGKGWL